MASRLEPEQNESYFSFLSNQWPNSANAPMSMIRSVIIILLLFF